MRRSSKLRAAILGIGLGTLLITGAPAATATTPQDGAGGHLDREQLQQSLDAVRDAGMYGTYSAVRDGKERWAGASGVADVDTGRPVTPDMEHRVGSVTKAFTSTALLQLVGKGKVALDAPVADYVPDLVPGERGRAVTVRMLLNHTSGIGDYVLGAFPGLLEDPARTIEENRFRGITPAELIRFGLEAEATGQPGQTPGHYSNTNYVIAGEILRRVTGQDPERWITDHVIRPAGLRHTYFPRTAYIKGPHSKMYESLFGMIDPPLDAGVYDMSWAGTAGALVSTMDDLDRFYRALLGGRLLAAPQLAEMQRTVDVDGLDYGLGVYTVDIPGCGRLWGHNGSVFGAGTYVMSTADGERQVAVGINRQKYQRINEDGTVEYSPIDRAIDTHIVRALCPSLGTGTARTLAPVRLPRLDATLMP